MRAGPTREDCPNRIAAFCNGLSLKIVHRLLPKKRAPATDNSRDDESAIDMNQCAGIVEVGISVMSQEYGPASAKYFAVNAYVAS